MKTKRDFDEIQKYETFNWNGLQYYNWDSEHVKLTFARLADKVAEQ
jgi:hypothetical protein